MLSALIKVQPRKDGTVLDPLAIVSTKQKEKALAKGPKTDFAKTKVAKKPKDQKKADGVKERKPRKNKVVPASDNEDDEAEFSEFVPLENVPKDHYDGYVDEDVEMCGILSPEQDDVYNKKESEWSEFVKEEEERYAEEYETSSTTSQSVEGSLSASVDMDDDDGFDSFDTNSVDGDSFDPNDDDVFDYNHKKKEPKPPKMKTFSGIAIFEDPEWIP